MPVIFMLLVDSMMQDTARNRVEVPLTCALEANMAKCVSKRW